MGLGILTLLLVSLLALLALQGPPSEGSAEPAAGVRVGAPAPDFEAAMLDGGRVTLADLRGRPVWLNFWASWCVPCKEEMPELVAVGKEAESEGVRLISVDMGEDEETVRGFLSRNGYRDLPVALDRTGDISQAYGVYNLPVHVFIDSRGIVRRTELGKMDAAEMREAVGGLE